MCRDGVVAPPAATIKRPADVSTGVVAIIAEDGTVHFLFSDRAHVCYVDVGLNY